jgi:arsenate reductase (glutaredoxin)
MTTALVLSYAGCGTCKKALRWLADHGVQHRVRAIVESPPTEQELSRWVPASRKPLGKWLNTSGQSYRALGKAAIDAMSEAELVAALVADGKLVKRPVLVFGTRVLVGFDEAEYTALFAA